MVPWHRGGHACPSALHTFFFFWVIFCELLKPCESARSHAHVTPHSHGGGGRRRPRHLPTHRHSRVIQRLLCRFFSHGGSHAHVREIGAHSSTPTPGGGSKSPISRWVIRVFGLVGSPPARRRGGGIFQPFLVVFGSAPLRHPMAGGRHFSAGFGCFWFRPTPPTIGGGVTFFSRFWMFLVPPHSANHWRGGG